MPSTSMPSTSARQRPSIFSGLIWKEAMQLLPLLLALVGMSSLLHLVLGMIPGGKASFSGFLILVPNIFALGAPPMLIGQEEESGTLRWIRGLPVDWRWIASVKALVAVLGLSLTWLFSLAVIALSNYPSLFGGSEVFSVEAIGGFAYACAFSLYLLSCGFAVSWWLRSPIASLLTMLPLMVGLFFCTVLFSRVVVANRLVERGDFSAAHAAVLGTVTGLLLAVAAGAARRTLCRPWVRRRTRRWTAVNSAIQYAYQPVWIVPLHSPGRRFALLWQAFAQTWLGVFLLCCVGFLSTLIAVVISVLGQGRGLPDVAVVIGLVVTSFLGAMVFVTDNKNRRHRFLAERGIGPFLIWWTRQAVPLLAALGLTGIFFGVDVVQKNDPRASGSQGMQTLLLFASAFACGQLSGQAFRRPVVGMLAAPVAFLACSALAGSVLLLYPSYSWAGIGAVILLWLATLRLSRPWSEERMGATYYGRLAGWIGLAALAFVGTIAAVRYATTPAAMPAWHEETLALAKRTVAAEETSISLLHADPQPHPGSPPGERRYDVGELRKTADDVLEKNRSVLGQHARADAVSILETLRTAVRAKPANAPRQGPSPLPTEGDNGPATAYQAWLRAMLVSSRRLDQGERLWGQPAAGERLEMLAIDELLRRDSRELLGAAVREELVALVPTSAERAQWRKDYLLRGWLAYQRDPHHVPFLPLWGSGSPAELRRLIPAEQSRTGRFLDRAVRISLSQLADGLPPAGSPEEARRLQAWQTLVDDEFAGVDPAWLSAVPLPTSEWTRALEQNAERLRAVTE